MAEPISIQQLKDASLDVKSLEEVVNGDEDVVVTTRLGETYPSVKGSIKKVFETGGLPATPFETKALMTASALVDGDYAMVTDDTVNNGLYVKTAGAWVKSAYDPLTQAKSYTDNQATGSKAFDLIYGNTTSDGYGFQSSATTTTSNAFTKTYAGESLVIKGSPTSLIIVAIFTYDNNKQFISKSPNYGQQVTDREIPLPDGYIKINVLPTTAPTPNSPEWLETIHTIVSLKYNKLRREYIEAEVLDKSLYDVETIIKTEVLNTFKTKSLMDASALPDGADAQVTDDSDNNGLYVKEGGSWVKSLYDPVGMANARLDSFLYADTVTDLVIGNTIGSSGVFQPTSSRTRITTLDYIKTHSDETLILKGSEAPSISIYLHRYDKNKVFLNSTPLTGQKQYDVKFDVPDGYIKYALLKRDSDGVIIDIDDNTLIEMQQTAVLKKNKLSKQYAEVNEIYHKHTVIAPLEIGYIERERKDVYTAIGRLSRASDLTVDYDFKKERRSKKFLEVIASTPVSIEFDNGDAYLFEYDSSFEYVKHSALVTKQDITLSPTTKYIKVSFENLTQDNPVASITFVSKDSNPNWVFNVASPNRAWDNTNFTYEVFTSQGRDVLPVDANNSEQYTTDKYFNTGIIKLPPNYDPLGDPVRLIIFVQGSGGYLQFISGSINPAYESENPDEGIFNYWLNEGYAVLGIYPWTSKYDISISVNQGSPTAMAAYAQGYQWVVDRFNIARDGVFVSGKSSGGYCGPLLSYNMGIPVLATGLLAPGISPMREPFGPYYDVRLAYADDFGFEGDHTVLKEQEHTPAVARTEALFEYMRLNAPKIVGYNPFWNGLIGESLSELIEAGIDQSELDVNSEVNLSKQRVCPVPIKIWCAVDDEIELYKHSKLYIQSIKNAQGNAELRTMPDNTGGHTSVDISELALRVPTITTKTGLTHKNIALAMVELIQYFRRFG